MGSQRPTRQTSDALERQRRELLARVEAWLEAPMVMLGFVWLVLLGIELLAPDAWAAHPLLDSLGLIIWAVFIINFAIEILIAPAKGEHLRRNWLTALSLAIPALRVLRIARVASTLRVARATRGARLVKVVGSLNRGMRALGATMRRRGVGYVATLTAMVTTGGAAGMYTLERDVPGGFTGFGPRSGGPP